MLLRKCKINRKIIIKCIKSREKYGIKNGRASISGNANWKLKIDDK